VNISHVAHEPLPPSTDAVDELWVKTGDDNNPPAHVATWHSSRRNFIARRNPDRPRRTDLRVIPQASNTPGVGNDDYRSDILLANHAGIYEECRKRRGIVVRLVE
jgi:hypothetical protein